MEQWERGALMGTGCTDGNGVKREEWGTPIGWGGPMGIWCTNGNGVKREEWGETMG